MKAAVYKGNQTILIEEIDIPKPGSKQVLIKVNFSAICGTDVHAYMYDALPIGTVMGHEYGGSIVEIGKDVTKLKVKDRVVGGGGTPPPGKGAGFAILPRFNFRTDGFKGKPLRAYADYVVMEEWEPMKIPDSVSDQHAALCEPLAVAVRAIRLSKLSIGNKIGIIGAGPIGLFVTQVSKISGALEIIVSEPAKLRRKTAKLLGATKTLDPNESNIIEEMVSICDGLGPDIVYDCACIGETFNDSLNSAKRNGQVMLVGVPWNDIFFKPIDWQAREINIQSTFGAHPEDWKIAMKLIETKKVDLDILLPKKSYIQLEEIPKVFENLKNPTDELQMIVKL